MCGLPFPLPQVAPPKLRRRRRSGARRPHTEKRPRRGRTAHAYIFAGPRGTGKTTLARLLAKGLNCEQGPTGLAVQLCANCLRIAQGRRRRRDRDRRRLQPGHRRDPGRPGDGEVCPAEGEYKVYIIDEVHMLTRRPSTPCSRCWRSPRRHVVFVFATTEPHKIPATIVSRCQKFDFRPLSRGQIATASAGGRGGWRAFLSIPRPFLSSLATRRGGCGTPWPHWISAQHVAEGTIDATIVAQVLGVVEVERLQTGRCAGKR